MSYHLIEQPSYFRRETPCGPDCNGPRCRLAPPADHRQEYALGLCGAEVVRHRDDYCASGIAKPQWDHDWCRECIMLVQWSPEEEETFRRKGFLTESETDRAGMAIVAAFRKMGAEEAPRRWRDLLGRIRPMMPAEYPPTLAGWLQQVLECLDRKGSPPAYWPQEARAWSDEAARACRTRLPGQWSDETARDGQTRLPGMVRRGCPAIPKNQ